MKIVLRIFQMGKDGIMDDELLHFMWDTMLEKSVINRRFAQ